MIPRLVLKRPRRPLRVALRYWWPRRLTLPHNPRVYAWLWWNFKIPAAALVPLGACRHGVVDDICWVCYGEDEAAAEIARLQRELSVYGIGFARQKNETAEQHVAAIKAIVSKAESALAALQQQVADVRAEFVRSLVELVFAADQAERFAATKSLRAWSAQDIASVRRLQQVLARLPAPDAGTKENQS